MDDLLYQTLQELPFRLAGSGAGHLISWVVIGLGSGCDQRAFGFDKPVALELCICSVGWRSG